MRSFDGAMVHSLVPGIFSAEMTIAPRVPFADDALALPEARRLQIRGGGVARRTRPVVAQERPDPEPLAAPDPPQTPAPGQRPTRLRRIRAPSVTNSTLRTTPHDR